MTRRSPSLAAAERFLDLPWPVLAVRLEASSRCQLKCPVCPTGRGETHQGVVGSGVLGFEDFKGFIERHPRIRFVELSNWGEIFLNPEIDRIIALAAQKRIRLYARNGVNLNTVSDSTIEQLVRSGFRQLTVSIDGATPETYGQYRINGDFDQVIRNVSAIRECKQRLRSPFPRLLWQFIPMAHNQHEIDAARRMASRLGMSFQLKLNFVPSHAAVTDPGLVRDRTLLRVSSRAEFREQYGIPYFVPCYHLWFSPAINWDGTLLGCCENRWQGLGRVFESGLDACLRSDRYREVKRVVLGLEPAARHHPCSSCGFFHRHLGKTPLSTRALLSRPLVEILKAVLSS